MLFNFDLFAFEFFYVALMLRFMLKIMFMLEIFAEIAENAENAENAETENF